MLIPNHPHDERLAALASREPDALSDASLGAHVSSCARCTEVIDELAVVRSALAELPDIQPSRPLRFVPAVDEAPAPMSDRLGGWARRFFAPVLASGAALALVGAIGTAGPSLSGQSQSGAQPETGDVAQSEPAALMPAASEPAGEGPAAEAAGGAAATEDARTLASEGIYGDAAAGDDAGASQAAAAGGDNRASEAPEEGTTLDLTSEDGVPAERSPWPMVLFAGVALMIAALLMRWILAPRVG
jgi:hypothetical protein